MPFLIMYTFVYLTRPSSVSGVLQNFTHEKTSRNYHEVKIKKLISFNYIDMYRILYNSLKSILDKCYTKTFVHHKNDIQHLVRDKNRKYHYVQMIQK
jgi:hypothetical protein